MKISKNKKSSKIKTLIILLAIVVALLLVYGVYSYNTGKWPFASKNQLDTSTIDGTQKTTNQSPRNDNPTQKDDDTPQVNPGKTTDQIPVSKDTTATITQLQQVGNQVTFNASITNTTSAGTCVVTFSTPNDRPVSKQFTATTKGADTSCGPLSIPASEFSFLGQWSVTLRYYTGDEQAVAEGSVVIK